MATSIRKKEAVVAPEDNWMGAGNPSSYFDELPQPYRFINKCLQDLILNPVSEAITKIEERKKTTEYEGFVKEAQATGALDLDRTTVMENIGMLLGPGGTVPKEEQQSIANKIVCGDNFGEVQLVDISRKLVLDRFKVPGLMSRRIISITSSSIEWVGTQLTYVAVVARGSPIVNILGFKHNENKLRRLYSINVMPDLPNPETPELNERQTYHEFPYAVKLSMDGVFLTVTLVNGAVKLLRMPPVLNPLEPESKGSQDMPQVGSSQSQSKPPGPGGKNAPVEQRQSQEMGSMQSLQGSAEGEQTILLKNDLDKFNYEELDLTKHLITTIAAKKKSEFVDPFSSDTALIEKSLEEPVPETAPPVKKPDPKGKGAAKDAVPAEPSQMEIDDGTFKYYLGKKH